jgi:5'-deoxynucleotidase
MLSKLPHELQRPYSELLEPTEADAESVALVKIADKLCAYIKTITEESAGNKDFVSARKTLEKALDSIDSDELRFFRENLLTAFTLTIDEM